MLRSRSERSLDRFCLIPSSDMINRGMGACQLSLTLWRGAETGRQAKKLWKPDRLILLGQEEITKNIHPLSRRLSGLPDRRIEAEAALRIFSVQPLEQMGRSSSSTIWRGRA
jgi:hypothetical protein